jgi:hypothetical protein
MATAYEITEIVFMLAIVFSMIKVLDFYGIAMEEYAIYLTFYLFILFSKFVLPSKIAPI